MIESNNVFLWRKMTYTIHMFIPPSHILHHPINPSIYELLQLSLHKLCFFHRILCNPIGFPENLQEFLVGITVAWESKEK